jgi:site-specific recombinase XerD
VVWVPVGDRPAEPLAPEEVRALLVECGGGSLSAIRDHALLVVLWRAGLRIGEALRLRASDVNFAAGTIRVLHTKTRQARTVGIDDAALAVLSVWVETRQAAGIPSGPLFCRLHGKAGAPLSSRYVRAQMGRLAVRAGVQHRVHPHGLRHTMAVESVKEGLPVTKISRQLGHSSIATTAVYLDHLYPGEVVDAYRARTW